MSFPLLLIEDNSKNLVEELVPEVQEVPSLFVCFSIRSYRLFPVHFFFCLLPLRFPFFSTSFFFSFK